MVPSTFFIGFFQLTFGHSGICFMDTASAGFLADGAWMGLGVALLAILGLAAWGLWGARSLVQREFLAYFYSPIAYAVLVVFLACQGFIFSGTLELLNASGPRGVEWPLQYGLSSPVFWLVFLAIPPLLTMRSFAEERASGTLEVLMTAPVRDWQIVLAKFAAALAFYLVLWLPTLLYLPALLGIEVTQLHWVSQKGSMLALAGGSALFLALVAFILGWFLRLDTAWLVVLGSVLGLTGLLAGQALAWHESEHLIEATFQLDPSPVVSTAAGVILAGAMFISLGLFVSSLVRDQLVAAQVALALGLVFVAGSYAGSAAEGGLGYRLAYFLSVPLHFERAFTRGVVDVGALALYASVAFFSLYLTVRSLESRRWA